MGSLIQYRPTLYPFSWSYRERIGNASKATRRRSKKQAKEKKRKAISPTGSRTPSGSSYLSTSDDVPRQLGPRPPFSGSSSVQKTVLIFIFITAPVNATSTYTEGDLGRRKTWTIARWIVSNKYLRTIRRIIFHSLLFAACPVLLTPVSEFKSEGNVLWKTIDPYIPLTVLKEREKSSSKKSTKIIRDSQSFLIEGLRRLCLACKHRNWQ